MTKPTTQSDLKIEQGQTYKKVWDFFDAAGAPYDMSVFTAARCEFRLTPDRNSPVILELQLNNGLIIDTENSAFYMELTDTQTYLFLHNKVTYDIILTLGTGENALTWKFARGDVQVILATTYPPV